MSMQQQIEFKIRQAFPGAYTELKNESHMHSGPATESHFKLALVSDDFEGVSRVKRHQMIYKILEDEMTKIHALALHTYSKAEWQQLGNTLPDSPKCAGGSKV